jgi:site-specific DNA recombinase
MLIQRAILYIRVSTDEQAEKGYSLKHQEEKLLSYCKQNNIEIADIYKEDYSAKTFSRPAFSSLFSVLKSKKHSINLLLFLKWDRFSRNAGDAYFMIKQLNHLGVEPHAIEQPLDLTIPENKLMLAFYLAAPEVENDRRSLNIVMGMRRARKEGRYVNKAPIGYKNTRDERNNPIIVPSKDALVIKLAFEEMAKGITSIQDSWRHLIESGIKLSRSQTHELFRNPFYCGKVIIPAYKEEKMEIIYGIHDGIVSENVFNRVQEVLDGKKMKIPIKEKSREEFPLRGILKCQKCNKRMTASASRGNGGKYFYYHCSRGCTVRYRTGHPNRLIIKILKKIKANQTITELYKSIILKNVFESCQGNIALQVKTYKR